MKIQANYVTVYHKYICAHININTNISAIIIYIEIKRQSFIYKLSCSSEKG